MNKKWIGILTMLLSAITLCVPALINKFPFVYSDTGTYIYVGFTDDISWVRPTLYGIFMRHASLKESLWFVIFAQALITVWFVRRFSETLFPRLPDFFSLLIIVFLTATTSIGVVTGMLMPDFTTVILIFAPAIVLYGQPTKWWNVILIYLGLWFALASHHSHAYIFVLILILLGLRSIIQWKTTPRRTWIGFIPLVLALVIGHYTIPYIHYQRKGVFEASKADNIFLVGRMNQMGLLKPFLDEKCPTHDFSICAYRDAIPSDFLWDGNSPANKDGGWDVNNDRYAEVVKTFLNSPNYLKKAVVKTFETAAQQFFIFKTVQLQVLKPNEWPQFVFATYLPDVMSSLQDSRQHRGEWNDSTVNLLQHLLVFSSGLYLIYLFAYQRNYPVPAAHRHIGYLLLAGLLSNAFICGGISMIAPRFQSRIIWLVPLTAFCLGYYHWEWQRRKRVLVRNAK
ncbi:MAG: hypothetical protein WBA17_13295 [Saprospiraceae bacterium]